MTWLLNVRGLIKLLIKLRTIISLQYLERIKKPALWRKDCVGEIFLSCDTLHRAILSRESHYGMDKQLIEKLSEKLEKNPSYSYLLPERGNISSESNQGTVTDPVLFNISVNKLDARPENALFKCVKDSSSEVLLSPWRQGSQIKTNSELENIKLEKCCNTEMMKLCKRWQWSGEQK